MLGTRFLTRQDLQHCPFLYAAVDLVGGGWYLSGSGGGFWHRARSTGRKAMTVPHFPKPAAVCPR